MKKKSSDNIFLDEKSSEKSDEKFKDSLNLTTLPYLKRGDSSVYINQFLNKEEEQLQAPPAPKIETTFTPVVQEQPKEENAHSESPDSNSEERP